MSKRQILLTVFMHEDLKDTNEDELYLNHFDWLADTIAAISGRAMDVNFISASTAPAICSLDYKTDHLAELLKRLHGHIFDYVDAGKIAPDNNLHKFLLLTRDRMNANTLGVAYTPGILGVASIMERVAAAHEVGHMFNAIHEDAQEEVPTYYGTARSTMYPTADDVIAFHFSDKNQANIRNYLNKLD